MENEKDYFTHYESLDVHKVMLLDKPRTLAYKEFIESNSDMFLDKVVLDVGAGTGILSLFAAKAGAKKVYAVECNNVSYGCQKIVEKNGFSHIINVIHSTIEKSNIPEKVDIIISEWMGFYLLTESMLDSVIFARDKFLKPNGIVIPSTASLYVCPVSLHELMKNKVEYWENVYSYDFSMLMHVAKQSLLTQPHVMLVESAQLLAEPELLLNMDLKYVTTEELEKIALPMEFKFSKNGFLHGFALWFDVEFHGKCNKILSTGPNSCPTHWKQTIFVQPDALMINKQDVMNLNFILEKDSLNRRKYNVSIDIIDEDDENAFENDFTNEVAANIESILNSK